MVDGVRSKWILFVGCLALSIGLGVGAGPLRAEEPPSPGESSSSAEPAASPDSGEPARAPDAGSPTQPAVAPDGGEPEPVYVLPVQGQINKPILYILRRGLKEAEANGVQTVILDIDTPGGALAATLDIMEAIDRFSGEVYTFIDPEAISAGAFISIATDEIFFSPRGIIGAAEAVSGSGQDIPESMQRKLESYLQAKVRSLTGEYRYRAQVMRAMSDPDYELKIGDEVLKEKGELLSLTAEEAMRTYGDPPEPLLGAGIYDSVDDLVAAELGSGAYEVRIFEVSAAESVAHYLNTLSPILLGLGMLLLFIEFKTPGFGVFGIGGIALLAVVFLSSHLAGLAGYEPLLVFVLGVLLIFLEVFLLPGLIFPSLLGGVLILGSLIWGMADIWPDQPIDFTGGTFTAPLLNLMLGVVIAVVGAVFLVRFLPKTWVWNRLVLQSAVGRVDTATPPAGSGANGERPLPTGWPEVGAEGRARTDLFPNGEVEIAGRRYQAKAPLGQIEHGTPVRVTGYQDFALTVESARRGREG